MGKDRKITKVLGEGWQACPKRVVGQKLNKPGRKGFALGIESKNNIKKGQGTGGFQRGGDRGQAWGR